MCHSAAVPFRSSLDGFDLLCCVVKAVLVNQAIADLAVASVLHINASCLRESILRDGESLWPAHKGLGCFSRFCCLERSSKHSTTVYIYRSGCVTAQCNNLTA